jgi:hypothetical protein
MTKDSLCGDELLIALMAQFPAGALLKLPNPYFLQVELYDFYRNRKFIPLFANYPFDVDGAGPICTELTAAFHALQLTGMLTTWTSQPDHYVITPALHVRYSTAVLPKLDTLLNLVQEMAASMRNRFTKQPWSLSTA